MSYNPEFLVPYQLASLVKLGHSKRALHPFWQGRAGQVSAGIYHSHCRHRGFDTGCFVCERQRAQERDGERERGSTERQGRVHVAAVAQLVREERKRMEQIHPKACCPTCLCTHTYTLCCVFICLSFTVLGV